MSKNIQFIAIASLLLAGCGLSEDESFDLPEGVEPVEADEPVTQVASNPGESTPVLDPAFPIDHACYGAPLIGILDDYVAGGCDLDGALPPKWSGVALFGEGSPAVEDLSLGIPGQMNAYCRFDYTGEEDWASAYTQLIDQIVDYPWMDVGSLNADCLAYGPMAGLDDSSVSGALEQAFTLNVDNQQEALDSLAYDPVHLRVLDTIDHDSWLGGTIPGNEHGLQMRALIEDIACPPSAIGCHDQIEQVLVTPRDKTYRTDWKAGRNLGVLSDFSLAVYYAVQSWREHLTTLPPGRHERLVLNASVGADFQAVFAADINRGSLSSTVEALTMAACYGVIIVGSAGNVRDESCPASETNMLVPAAFETLMMPDEDTCAQLGYAPDWDLDTWPVFPPPGVDRPLIYAVGGVDGLDKAINNSRPNSAPRLVATAANAISAGGDTPLTGTSVGAAVVSATAKLGWGVDSKQRPDQLMQTIYDAGYALGRATEDGNWVGDDQHRLSVCAAIDSVSGGMLGCSAPAPEPLGNLGDFAAATEGIVSDPGNNVASYSDALTEHPPICDPIPLTETLAPQPEMPICAFCSAGIAAGVVNYDDLLFIDIDPYYEGVPSNPDHEIVSIKLILDTGVEMTFKSKVVNEIRESLTTQVHEVRFQGPTATTAALQFELKDGSTQTNTIPIYNLPIV